MPHSAIAAARPLLHVLRVPAWAGIPQLTHGFCGRHGGVSQGSFAELNLSSRVGDDPDAVGENWRRVAEAAGAGLRFMPMTQMHGTDIATVTGATAEGGAADGLVTAAPGLALSVLTADCVPMLMIAPRQRVVAAVHAGWRGTVLGIAARAVEHLQREFGVRPGDVRVALGPTIGRCCYEVGAEIVDELETRWGAMPGAVRRQPDVKPHLDLRAANAAILKCAGVRPADILNVGSCTKCSVAEYFSHRAASAAGGRPTGRQLSFIGWCR